MRGLLLVLLATSALAAKPKVIIDAPAPMKALLTKALKKKFTPVPPKANIPDEPGANAVKQAVRAAGAVGLVTARLEGGIWSVMALNGADGSPLEQFKFKAPPPKKPLKALPKGTDKRLEKALATARAPAKEDAPKKDEPKKDEPVAEDPKKEEPKKEDPKKEDPKKKKVKDPSPVEPEKPVEKEPPPAVEEPVERGTVDKPVALYIGAGFRMFSRRFFYNQDLFETLSKYSLRVGPAIQAEADWYPAAHFTSGPATSVGLSVGFNYAVGITSVASDGTRFSTSAARLRLGLIGRIKVGILELQPQVGWVLQNYNIASNAGALKPNIPDVRYSNFRVGLGTRTTVYGPFGVTAGFAYQAPLTTGEIGSTRYFPRLKAGGLDANFGIVLGPLLDRVELRLGVDYIRYWYSMNPEPGDANVAGGALDDYAGANVMLMFTL